MFSRAYLHGSASIAALAGGGVSYAHWAQLFIVPANWIWRYKYVAPLAL